MFPYARPTLATRTLLGFVPEFIPRVVPGFVTDIVPYITPVTIPFPVPLPSHAALVEARVAGANERGVLAQDVRGELANPRDAPVHPPRPVPRGIDDDEMRQGSISIPVLVPVLVPVPVPGDGCSGRPSQRSRVRPREENAYASVREVRWPRDPLGDLRVVPHAGAVREDELGDDGGAEGSLESLLTILEDGECESVGYRVRADHLSDEAADAELGDAATPPAHLATVAVVGDGM